MRTRLICMRKSSIGVVSLWRAQLNLSLTWSWQTERYTRFMRESTTLIFTKRTIKQTSVVAVIIVVIVGIRFKCSAHSVNRLSVIHISWIHRFRLVRSVIPNRIGGQSLRHRSSRILRRCVFSFSRQVNLHFSVFSSLDFSCRGYCVLTDKQKKQKKK